MLKVAFRNLGCKVNEYELEYMQQKMADFGFEIVPFDVKSDIYVINTCTVTNIADRKSRQMLHKAKKQNLDAIVVAVGCYVQTDMERVLSDTAVDLCIGNNNKSRLPEIITEYIKDREENTDTERAYLTDLTYSTPYEDMLVKKTSEHTRAYIKIEDGCNQFCAYCAIPLARGRVRSRALSEIENEAKKLAANGYKEVVLTGIHISSYGLDFHADENGKSPAYNELAGKDGYTNYDLLNVIELLQGIDGIERIRLSSLEPRLITESFLTELVKSDKLCPHFHLSLQSGCDDTLKRMNRGYCTDDFLKSVSLLNKYFTHPAVTTDIIAGFPGETDAEFEKTIDFLNKVGFYEMHVFKYSKRKNTVAERLPNQVSDEVKSKRSDVLIELSEGYKRAFSSYYIGKDVEVLFEEEKDGLYTGHTREYVNAYFKSDKDISGSILTLRVRESKDGILYF